MREISKAINDYFYTVEGIFIHEASRNEQEPIYQDTYDLIIITGFCY